MLSSLVGKPLIQNPLAGGPSLTVPNPRGEGPRGGGQFEGYDFMKGFKDSEFYKKANRMQQDDVKFKFDGKDMNMNSSMAGALQQYLDSIGKGDLFQSDVLLAGPLAQIKGLGDNLAYQRRPNNPSDPIPSLNPDVTPSFDLKQADPNNLISGYTPPTGGTFNGMPLFPETLGGGIDNLPEFGRPPSMFSNTGGIGSLIGLEPVDQTFNSQQTFNQQRFNEYVDSLVNERLKDFFGGIMGAIDV